MGDVVELFSVGDEPSSVVGFVVDGVMYEVDLCHRRRCWR